MASTTPLLGVARLVCYSVLLTVALGFGLPAALSAVLGGRGAADRGVTEGIVVCYLVFVLWMAAPRLPRGRVEAKGQSVLITGCDSGFGNALAKHLHRLGFTVFAGCVLKDGGGEGARELLELRCEHMKVLQLDGCSEQQVSQAVEYVRDNLGEKAKGLWALVNAAGATTFGEVEFTPMDTYKQVSEVNLWGTIRVTKAFLPLVRKAKGRVVNLVGVYGRLGVAQRSPLCVSQHGVEAFSDCLRHEMRPWGVAVCVVEPGSLAVTAGTLAQDAMSNAASKLWREAPTSVKEDYGKVHFDQQVARVRSGCGAWDAGPVLEDVADAVLSKRPYTRYNPMEPHWWVRMQLATHLPAAISDRLCF